MDLLEPKTIALTDSKGKEREFILSKFPAVQGREIIAKYPVSLIMSAFPKIADYDVNEEIMLKMMCFVGINIGDKVQTLSSRVLVNNHVYDWQCLANLEMAMMEYNCAFFHNGKISDFLQSITLEYLPKILETLMDSLAQSSRKEGQPYTN